MTIQRSKYSTADLIERPDHLVTLHREVIDAMGMHCSECDAATMKLFVFYTMRGNKRRTHNGAFCSKMCHDKFHGLKPRVRK